MNMNLYLPDAIGARARAARLPLSRMLRAAVEEELRSRAADEAAVQAAFSDWNSETWLEKDRS